MGEPLIDPKFFERVKKIKDSYECTTFISTNALQLTKEKSLRMIESKLDTIIISLDGVDQDSFSKIREGSFEKTVRNIEELISLKEKMKSETPYITLRIMVSSENKKDTKRFIERWEGKVNEIAFGKVHTWCEGGIKKSLNSPCLFLWSTLLILSNGDVVVDGSKFSKGMMGSQGEFMNSAINKMKNSGGSSSTVTVPVSITIGSVNGDPESFLKSVQPAIEQSFERMYYEKQKRV